MKHKLCLLLCLLATPKLLLALSQEDFAYIAEIQTTEDTPFYELEVPAVVYETITRDDLGDLRVLNANGQVVPHGLRTPKVEKTEKIGEAKVAFFPLFEQTGSLDSDLSLNIQRSQNGEIININSHIPENNMEQRLTGYLLDLKEWDKPISEIVVNWKNTGNESFIRKLKISKSLDLARWQHVASGKTLVNMDFQNHKLTENSIKLEIEKTNYLKLHFEDQKPGLEVDSIQIYHTQLSYKKLNNWKTVSLEKTTDDGEYTFNSGLKALVHDIDIKLPESNTVVRVNVSSRSSNEDQWHHRGSALLYRLAVNGTNIEHSVVNINPSRDTQWLLKFDQQGGGIGAGTPQVKFSWHPQQLVFVARGGAPYRIAWGSARVEPVNINAGQLLPNLDKTGLANTNMVSTASLLPDSMQPVNKEMLKAQEKEINWQLWILWIVLVVSALMLIWMAVRLMKKMMV